jgi:hypothetical protein
MGVLKIDKKLQDQLFAEIQDSLSAELNYEIEVSMLSPCSRLKVKIRLEE